MFCQMFFGLVATFACISGITGHTPSGNQSGTCENYMASCLRCTEDVYCYCTRRAGKVVRLPCVESSSKNRYLKVYDVTRDGSKLLICPTDHEYISQLPSKKNLASKNLIQHYCRCKDELEKVFPLLDCPDLKSMEVNIAPQSCSNQQHFLPTSAPPTPCPTTNSITPICNCNCTYPTPLPTTPHVCTSQTTKAPPPTKPTIVTPCPNCTEMYLKLEKSIATHINVTIVSLFSEIVNSSARGDDEILARCQIKTEEPPWTVVAVCGLGLLVVVAVLQVALLLAILCRKQEPSKKLDVVMMDEIVRPQIEHDPDYMIANDMYGRF